MRLRSRRAAWFTLGPLAVAAVGYLMLVGAYLLAAGGNFTFFVHANAESRVAQAFGGAAGGLYLHPGVHDGISYYAIARDPFDLARLGKILDSPGYRYRRIIYPLLTHLLSFGRSALVPVMLLVVNLAAALAGGYCLQRLTAANGLHPAWTLLYYFHPGIILSLLYDLPTSLALLFVILGLMAYRRGRFGAAALAVTLAVLTWEWVALPVVVGLLVAAVIKPRPLPAGRFPWVLILPLAVAGAWPAVVQQLLPAPISLTVVEVAGNFTFPGLGWWRSLQSLVGTPGLGGSAFTFTFLATTAVSIALAFGRFLTDGGVVSRLALLSAVLIFCLTPPHLVWPLEATRKTLGLWLFTFLGYAVHRDRTSWLILLGTLLATPLLVPWLPPLTVR